MCRTRFTLSDLGAALPARALLAFVRHAGPGTALWREAHGGPPEDVLWHEGGLYAQLMARISDELEQLAWTVAQAHSDHDLRSRFPRPMRRPGVDDGSKRIGRDPVGVAEFGAWWSGGKG